MNDENQNPLCEEQLRLLADALRSSGISESGKARSLGAKVERAIDYYKPALSLQVTFRTLTDAFVNLLKVANEKDPRVGFIRISIKKLSKGIIKAIEERGQDRWETLSKQPYSENGFVDWSQNAPPLQLIEALNHLLSDGEMIVQGRNRPSGRRSAAELRPIVMGVVRGKGLVLAAGHRLPRDGRPPAVAEDELVRDLGFAWAEETGLTPSFAQTDRAGFGKVVHLVFSWLGLDANQALRRFGSRTVPLKAFQQNEWVS